MKTKNYKIAAILGCISIAATLSGYSNSAFAYNDTQKQVQAKMEADRVKYQQYKIEYSDPNNTSWNLSGSAGFLQKNGDVIPYSISYLPVGQSEKYWQEAITEDFHFYAEISEQLLLTSIAENDLNRWKKKFGCQGKEWKIIQNTSQEIMYSGKLLNCNKQLPQDTGNGKLTEIYITSKEFKSTDGYYFLTYVASPSTANAARQQQIKTMLMDAHLVPMKG